MTGEGAFIGYQAPRSHVFEDGLLHESQRWLGELGCGKQPAGRGVRIGVRVFVDGGEYRLRLHNIIDTCSGSVRKGHVVVADASSSSTTEVDSKLSRVVLHYIGDPEPYDC